MLQLQRNLEELGYKLKARLKYERYKQKCALEISEKSYLLAMAMTELLPDPLISLILEYEYQQYYYSLYLYEVRPAIDKGIKKANDKLQLNRKTVNPKALDMDSLEASLASLSLKEASSSSMSSLSTHIALPRASAPLIFSKPTKRSNKISKVNNDPNITVIHVTPTKGKKILKVNNDPNTTVIHIITQKKLKKKLK